MGTIPQRRRYEPSWERERWRADLFQLYRRQNRYKNLIEQELRWDWREVSPVVGASPVARFRELQDLAGGADPPAALINYLDNVRRTVRHTLRLVARGAVDAPALWACDYVHRDASLGVWDAGDELRFLEPADAAAYRKVGGEIRLNVFVSPWSAEWYCVGPGGESGGRLFPLGPDLRDQQAGGRVNWDGLRDGVGKAVDHQLDTIAADFEKAYPKQRNAAFDPAQATRLDALVGILFLRERRPDPRTERDEHEGLSRLARELGIAYPPPAASEKTRP